MGWRLLLLLMVTIWHLFRLLHTPFYDSHVPSQPLNTWMLDHVVFRTLSHHMWLSCFEALPQHAGGVVVVELARRVELLLDVLHVPRRALVRLLAGLHRARHRSVRG